MAEIKKRVGSGSKTKNTKASQKNKKLPKADQYVKELKGKQAYMPFTDHLEELRSKLLRSLAGFLVSAVVCFFFMMPFGNM